MNQDLEFIQRKESELYNQDNAGSSSYQDIQQVKKLASKIIVINEDEQFLKYKQQLNTARYTNFELTIPQKLFKVILLINYLFYFYVIYFLQRQKLKLFISISFIIQTIQLKKQLIKSIFLISSKKINLIIFLQNCWSEQKRIINLLFYARVNFPHRYLNILNEIYLLNTGFLIRTYLLFSKLFQNKAKKNYQMISLKKLKNLNIIDESHYNDLPLNNFSSQSQLLVKNKSNKDEKKYLGDYSMTSDYIPEILIHLTNYFDMYKQHYEYQGIFRVNGSISQEQQLQQKLMDEDYECIVECDDPTVIASLIKKFLRDLKEPLIPTEFYEEYINITKNFSQKQDQTQELKKLIQKLDVPNKNTICFIINFLLKFSQYSEKNLMTLDNLAILISPCLSWLQTEDVFTEILNSKLMVKTSFLLLTDFDEVFSSIKYFTQFTESKGDILQSNNIEQNIKQNIENNIENIENNIENIENIEQNEKNEKNENNEYQIIDINILKDQDILLSQNISQQNKDQAINEDNQSEPIKDENFEQKNNIKNDVQIENKEIINDEQIDQKNDSQEIINNENKQDCQENNQSQDEKLIINDEENLLQKKDDKNFLDANKDTQ